MRWRKEISHANDLPTVKKDIRADAELASELRLSVTRLRRRLVNEHEPVNYLSMNAMAVLRVLYRIGDLTVGELAAHEHVRPPNMALTVKLLAKSGHVTRR